jgi:hypothetical protein
MKIRPKHNHLQHFSILLIVLPQYFSFTELKWKSEQPPVAGSWAHETSDI